MRMFRQQLGSIEHVRNDASGGGWVFARDVIAEFLEIA